MNKTSIKIYNVGPIKKVEIDDLKRVNVFIGASASGKSTIAKIISQALWCEKAFITTGREMDFKDQLIAFHRFSDAYFTDSSRIEYQSPWLTITCQRKRGKLLRFDTKYTPTSGPESLYNNIKIQYIPAERNFVTSIPNLQEYNKAYDNVFSFLQDWLACKGQYNNLKSCYKVQDVEGMKLLFRTLREGTLDYVRVGKSTIDIELLNSSSGIQSILPLLLVSDEMLEQIYKKDRPFSYHELKNLENVAPKELMPIIRVLNEMSRSANDDADFTQALDGLWKAVGYNGAYSKTHLTVEEPEQNIYPATQRTLIYHLLNRLQNNSSLVITTHSPYVLYAFDNALVAGQVARVSAEVKNQIPQNIPSDFTDDEVALWLVAEGGITPLIDPDTHALGENEFNSQLGYSVDEMSELYSLLEAEDNDKE